jgi:FlaG/FlaF family flagellin (archaellin)
MRRGPDQAVSEVIGTILMVLLVVGISAIIAAIVMGIPLLPQKPVLAAFSADGVNGVSSGSPHTQTVPVIRFNQMAGDRLTQNYTQGVHKEINQTKIKLIDPNGRMITVEQSVTLIGTEIEKGETFFIFRRDVGEPNQYWLTNDPDRILNFSEWGGVDPFTPHGSWRLIVTDEKDTNMVIFML